MKARKRKKAQKSHRSKTAHKLRAAARSAAGLMTALDDVARALPMANQLADLLARVVADRDTATMKVAVRHDINQEILAAFRQSTALVVEHRPREVVLRFQRAQPMWQKPWLETRYEYGRAARAVGVVRKQT